MVLITALTVGGIAVGSAIAAKISHDSAKKAVAEAEAEKVQAIEATKQKELALEAAEKSPSIAAGLSPGIIDDIAVLLERALPFILLGVGAFVILSQKKK